MSRWTPAPEKSWPFIATKGWRETAKKDIRMTSKRERPEHPLLRVARGAPGIRARHRGSSAVIETIFGQVRGRDSPPLGSSQNPWSAPLLRRSSPSPPWHSFPASRTARRGTADGWADASFFLTAPSFSLILTPSFHRPANRATMAPPQKTGDSGRDRNQRPSRALFNPDISR